MNAHTHDVTTYEPCLTPATVFARRELDGTLDDTLETGFAEDEEADAPAHGRSVSDMVHSTPVVRETVRVSTRQQAPVQQSDDTALVAVGTGLVSVMMALLMMLASGYGAA